ncbi:expressed unknown protein [Seminavis robusta]|uniref:G-protein coupled receptors family 2 profile 2 domain-containing protein n=1 Tax=Seminavis robusta TaxID=568900 RepID=A0A9N8HSE7_9STRA|nr:expressed unknown protein [Seminavis robusta]|eukprot:Sro1511_g278770.1 n/a (395) ;mRNA; r:23994-25276
MVSSMQSKVLAILPKCTGGLSLVGSISIVYDLVKKIHLKPSGSANTFQRIMLGLSCFDLICSFCNVLSTWPSPDDSGVHMAVGNTQTCTAQGFFNELGNVGAVLYSVSLSLHYVWQISSPGLRNRLPPKQEVWLHVVPMILALIMAVLGLPLDLYNNSGWLCWYAPYPKGCNGDECTRGQLAGIFRWIHYGIVWGAILLVTISMYSIFRVVWATENRASKIRARIADPTGNGFLDEDKDGTDSVHSIQTITSIILTPRIQRVATQAFLYVAGLYLTWIFTTLTRVIQTTQGVTHLELLILMGIFFPLQGFWNALIYFRSQANQEKSQIPSTVSHVSGIKWSMPTSKTQESRGSSTVHSQIQPVSTIPEDLVRPGKVEEEEEKSCDEPFQIDSTP